MHGRKFWLAIPFGEGVEPDSVEPVLVSDFSGLRVLVIDGDETTRAILCGQVRSWGMRCSESSSVLEGIARLRAEVASGDPFGVLLLDTQTPEMRGLEMARARRSDPVFAGLRVLFLTLPEDHDFRNEVQKEGVAVCLTKPVRQSSLLDRLAEFTSGMSVRIGPTRAAR